MTAEGDNYIDHIIQKRNQLKKEYDKLLRVKQIEEEIVDYGKKIKLLKNKKLLLARLDLQPGKVNDNIYKITELDQLDMKNNILELYSGVERNKIFHDFVLRKRVNMRESFIFKQDYETYIFQLYFRFKKHDQLLRKELGDDERKKQIFNFFSQNVIDLFKCEEIMPFQSKKMNIRINIPDNDCFEFSIRIIIVDKIVKMKIVEKIKSRSSGYYTNKFPDFEFTVQKSNASHSSYNSKSTKVHHVFDHSFVNIAPNHLIDYNTDTQAYFFINSAFVLFCECKYDPEVI